MRRGDSLMGDVFDSDFVIAAADLTTAIENPPLQGLRDVIFFHPLLCLEQNFGKIRYNCKGEGRGMYA